MQVHSNIQAAVDFVIANVELNCRIMTNNQGDLVYIDEVLAIDDKVVVVINRRFYMLCIQGSQFFVDNEYDEAANDSLSFGVPAGPKGKS